MTIRMTLFLSLQCINYHIGEYKCGPPTWGYGASDHWEALEPRQYLTSLVVAYRTLCPIPEVMIPLADWVEDDQRTIDLTSVVGRLCIAILMKRAYSPHFSFSRM